MVEDCPHPLFTQAQRFLEELGHQLGLQIVHVWVRLILQAVQVLVEQAVLRGYENVVAVEIHFSDIQGCDIA